MPLIRLHDIFINSDHILFITLENNLIMMRDSQSFTLTDEQIHYLTQALDADISLVANPHIELSLSSQIAILLKNTSEPLTVPQISELLSGDFTPVQIREALDVLIEENVVAKTHNDLLVSVYSHLG